MDGMDYQIVMDDVECCEDFNRMQAFAYEFLHKSQELEAENKQLMEANAKLFELWQWLENDLFRADLPDKSRLRGAVINGVEQAKKIKAILEAE